MLRRLRDRLRNDLKNGFWFRRLTSAIDFAYRRLSLGQRFKLWLTETSLEKAPPGASELYQLASLILALVWLAVIGVPIAPLSVAWTRVAGSAFALYRLLEILVFALHWTFVAGGELHGVRRSLAGFILNVLEIALYSSIAFILLDCVAPGVSQWAVVYDNLAATFRAGLAETGSATVCRIIAHLQLFAGGIVLSITVASLVGGVLRGEIKRPPSGDA